MGGSTHWPLPVDLTVAAAIDVRVGRGLAGREALLFIKGGPPLGKAFSVPGVGVATSTGTRGPLVGKLELLRVVVWGVDRGVGWPGPPGGKVAGPPPAAEIIPPFSLALVRRGHEPLRGVRRGVVHGTRPPSRGHGGATRRWGARGSGGTRGVEHGHSVTPKWWLTIWPHHSSSSSSSRSFSQRRLREMMHLRWKIPWGSTAVWRRLCHGRLWLRGTAATPTTWCPANTKLLSNDVCS